MAIKENVLPLAQDSGSGYIRTVSSGGASQRTAFDTVKGAITADMDEAIADEVDAREAADNQLQTEIDGKVDKVTGKGLSTNDFTNALKTKLDGIEAGAEVNVIETVKVNGTALVPDANRAVNVPAPTVDSSLSTTSENPVQNKIITGAINDVQADVDQNAGDISDLKEEINDKPNWTVGSAEQIVSDEASASDVTPYTFRRSGGGLIPFNFTREELAKVVGGTVAWNQLVQNGNFADTTKWNATRVTLSASGNVGTLTASSDSDNYIQQGVSFPQNHKIFYTIDYKANTARQTAYEIAVVFKGTTSDRTSVQGGTDTNWHTSAGVFVCSAETYRAIRLRCPSIDATTSFRNVFAIDLTSLFSNPAIADYIYSLETATAGSGIAKLREWGFFRDSYYSYDSGSLQSVCVGAHETVGRNQFDEATATIYSRYFQDGSVNAWVSDSNSGSFALPCLPNTTYIISCDNSSIAIFRVGYIDVDPDSLATSDSPTINGAVRKTAMGSTTITTGSNAKAIVVQLNNAIVRAREGKVQIEFGSTATAYEPYQKHTYALDSTKTLRGRFYLDSNNQLRSDGDVYPPSGEINRTYGEYTFTGSETWAWFASSQFWYMPLNGVNTINEKIKTSNGIVVKSNSQNQIRVYVSDNPSISENTNMNTVFSNGTAIVYPLITTTTETADPYTAVQICDSDGTEEFVDALVEAGTRDVAIPAGTETVYYEDMAGKLAELPPIPNAPSANGTYTLQAVVSSGAVTYQWTS